MGTPKSLSVRHGSEDTCSIALKLLACQFRSFCNSLRIQYITLFFFLAQDPYNILPRDLCEAYEGIFVLYLTIALALGSCSNQILVLHESLFSQQTGSPTLCGLPCT